MKLLFLLTCLSAVCRGVSSEPCKGSATYKVAFQGEWSGNTRPSGACFRGLLGCTHNHCYRMFEEDEEASSGVKDIAERGDSGALYKDMLKHLVKNEVKNILQVIETKVKKIPPEGNVILPETNTTTDGFQVDGTHPYVSIMVGIYPSPDWFLAVRGLSLCDTRNGSWIRDKKVVLFPYDAGTVDGEEFNSSYTKPSNPVERITKLDKLYLYDGQRGLGTFTFTRRKTFPRMRDEKVVTECRGEPAVLRREIEKFRINKTTLQAFQYDQCIPARGVTNLAGTTFPINVDGLRPLVSVIMKIDPSPDWFTGAFNVDLCDRATGKWQLEKKAYPLRPYDAGSRTGSEFTSRGSSDDEDISRIHGYPFNDLNDERKMLGMVQFSLSDQQSSTTVGKTENDETFVCPSAAVVHSALYPPLLVLIMLSHFYYT